MDWNKPKSKLQPTVKDINYLGKVNPFSPRWRALRDSTLIKKKQSCRYCGGRYSKYLICVHLDCDQDNDNSNNLDMCCQMCYKITHINYGFVDDTILCWSQLSQTEIIQKTITDIIKTGVIPDIQSIDPNAKKSPLSLMELCSILKADNNKILKNIKEIKVFFTKELDITFANYYISKGVKKSIPKSYMYIDSSSDSEEDQVQEVFQKEAYSANLKDIKLDDKTDKLLKNFFGVSSDNINSMMKHVLKEAKYIISEYHKKNDRTNISYNKLGTNITVHNY